MGYETSTNGASRVIVLSMNCASSMDSSMALCGQTLTQRPQPRQASLMTARSSMSWMASTKHTSWVQVPQPMQRSVTATVTPGMRVTLSPMRGTTLGKMRQRQQQGQQLQIVSSLSPGPTPSQTVSSLLRPTRCTRPASRPRRTCSNASSGVARRPRRGLMPKAASPKKRQPRSTG